MKSSSTSGTYYRLVALWAICEALLGGIIHGLRIPVSGLVVGSCAVICISLIAYYHPAKGSILKATVLVAIFKMMLSPQAPLPAYFAVFFQGLLGELLFWRRKFYPVACILFAVLALLESGLQRIVVLTLVYGNDLWKAINEFLNGLTGQTSPANYSFLIGSIYVALHLAAGIMVGFWTGGLPRSITHWKNKYAVTGYSDKQPEISIRKKRRIKKGLLIIWIILLILYFQSLIFPARPWLPSHMILRIFTRSIIIILAWYFLVSPLLKKLLNNWLKKKKAGLRTEINEVLELIPSTRDLLQAAWKNSATKKGFPRLLLLGKIVLANSIESNAIYILSGGTGIGKTTAILNWARQRSDVHGILTPVIDNKRFFLDIHTGDKWPMEAGENEKEVLQIGRFVFSKTGFDKAITVIQKAINKPGWLVIDELGPLELREEGFYKITKAALSKRNDHTLLVVREEIVTVIIQKFKIRTPKIIQKMFGNGSKH